jgi:hypothetical protein
MYRPSNLHTSLHLAEEQALLAQTAQRAQRAHNQSGPQGPVSQTAKPSKWIIGSKEVRSLIISALIFLTIFAWADVLASSYRDRVLKNASAKEKNSVGSTESTGSMPDIRTDRAGFPVKFPRRVPEEEEVVEQTMDLNLGAKVGYAGILTLISTVAFITLGRA